MIKAVSIDLWETIIHDNGSNRWEEMRLSAFEPVLSKYGATRERMKEAYRLYTEKFNLSRASNRCDIDVSEQICMFLDELNIAPTPELVKILEEPYVSPAIYHPPGLNGMAAHVLKTLRENGYRLGLVSNTGKTPGRILVKVLERYGIASYFNAFSFSNEVGYLKPRKEIFNDILNKLEATPEETIHIGDELYADIYGAKSMGMKTIWIESFRSNHGLEGLADESLKTYIKPDARIKNLGEILEIVGKF